MITKFKMTIKWWSSVMLSFSFEPIGMVKHLLGWNNNNIELKVQENIESISILNQSISIYMTSFIVKCNAENSGLLFCVSAHDLGVFGPSFPKLL